jgi:hypothetical protein
MINASAGIRVSGGGGSSDFITGKTVANYAALPDPTLNVDKLAIALASQGVWLINYKAKGLYFSDGATWEYQGDYELTDEASEIQNTPAGSIVATNVQAAINELDTDKLAVGVTTAAITDSLDKRYVTDAQLTVIGNTSGTNTGDNAVNTLYSGLVSNATHTGDATGATALTVVKIQGKDFPTLSGGDDQKYPKYVSASNAFVMTAIAGGGDMVLADVQTVSGLKTFLNGTLGLRNVANTFTSLFSNAATAARTYTLKDADGTIAFTSDITGTNSGTNTGDQTSIVGITGTKAQFDTAVTDGNIVYVGDTVGLATNVTTNANLTGEVTSTGNAAILDKTAITNRSVVAVAGTDKILFADTSNSDSLARCTAQDIANLASGGSFTMGKAIAISGQYLALN